MMTMAQELIYQGTPASSGIAIGDIFIHSSTMASAASPSLSSQSSAAAEEAKLKRAIATAQEDTRCLMEGLEETARDIMEFQLEMLNDEDFLAPVWSAIAAGESAPQAWQTSLAKEIDLYKQGGDGYLRERYVDLQDIFLRVLRLMAEDAKTELSLHNAILVADDLMPSEFLVLDRQELKGIALTGGNPQNHVAILARARQLPLVVSLKLDRQRLTAGENAVLDGEKGELICSPNESSLAAIQRRIQERDRERSVAMSFLTRTAVTKSNERIQVFINVNNPTELDNIEVAHCDGIGLVRTEFLFTTARMADEEEQLQAYERLITWAAGKPVTIRTMDIGGDKPITGIAAAAEANPFLGLRGLRFSLAQQKLFLAQLRALCRAAARGPINIMVPMVTVPAELARVRQLLQETVHLLKTHGAAYDVPALGMMVEVPAAALTAAQFDADFYSIGTNDLVQYATAAARDSEYEAVRALADAKNPGVLALIHAVVEAAGSRPVSVCGDIASDSRFTSCLIEQGVRSLSVLPSALGSIKRALAAV